MLERLLPFLPSNVKTEFSSRITDAENVEATAERPTHVRLTITPSQKHRDPDYVGPTRTFEADVVIGCDGVKSVLRTCVGAKGLDGATGRTERYTGSYGYRGLVKADDAVLANGNGVSVPSLWFGPSKVVYRVAASSRP
jgi:2-polyprenyl-6-methoxyphenol hydroxylase-like FAD-dependent oxidoreductase